MSKFVCKNNIFKRVSNEQAQELVTKKGWKYSNKFDWKKMGSPQLDEDILKDEQYGNK